MTGTDYGYFFYSSQPFLRVDSAGRRFHNESAPYDFVMSASSVRPEGDRFSGIRFGTVRGRTISLVSIQPAAR